jgi:hypothetical protein
MTFADSIARRIRAGLFVLASLAIAADALGAGTGSLGTGVSGTRGGGIGGAGYGGGGEAAGLGIFSSVPLRVTVSLQEGYDDNVFTRSLVEQASAFTNASIAAIYQFGSPRTQIEAHAGGGLTYYYDRPQQSGPDYNGFLEVSLTHKFTARISLEISSYTTYQTEPDFSLDIGVNRRSGSYFYSLDRFKLNYQFTPRFSTVTSYTIATFVSSNSAIGGLQNRIENTFGNEFRYLILPTTTAVGEYRIAFIDYTDSDASAVTHYFLAGFDHTFNPRLNATVRGGVQLREFESNSVTRQNSDKISPDLESTVTYQINERSNLSWTNRYGIQEGEGSSTNNARTSYHTGLTIKYGLTPRISSDFAFYYDHVSFGSGGANGAFDEDNINAALTLRYAITRYLAIQAGYTHTEVLTSDSVISTGIGRAYSRNRIYGGLTFIF